MNSDERRRQSDAQRYAMSWEDVRAQFPYGLPTSLLPASPRYGDDVVQATGLLPSADATHVRDRPESRRLVPYSGTQKRHTPVIATAVYNSTVVSTTTRPRIADPFLALFRGLSL
jgi:hypothetical protein